MKNKTIFIIGGAGFLGRSIFEILSKKPNLEVYYGDLKPLTANDPFFVYINVLCDDYFNRINKKFDYIINCTGQITNPTNTCYSINTTGTDNIINFVLKNSAKLIHVSTISVYGSSEEIIDEESKINPETPYAAFKSFAEYSIIKKLNNTQYSIFRFSNLYGETQEKGFIPYLLKCTKSSEEIQINNDGGLKRYFIHVKDAAYIIEQVIDEFKSGVYNIIGKDFFTIKELIDITSSFSKKTIKVKFQNIMAWENISSINTIKSERSFDLNFKYNLLEFIKNNLYN